MELSSIPTDTTAIVGIGLPCLISIIIQTHWKRYVQSLVALGACFAATLITNSIQGDSLGQGIGSMIAASFISYKTFWEPTGLANKIESSTNITDYE